MAIRLTLLLLLAFASPARAGPIDRWTAEIERASARFAIPAPWIRAVMRAESGGNRSWRGHPIVSRAGAMGLMQLMPGTWDDMRRLHGLGGDPFDPADNILAGTAYLRAMYDRFGYAGMLAAYNAGPDRYRALLRTGRTLPAETRAYVLKTAREAAVGSVATTPDRLADSPSRPASPPTLFAVRPVAVQSSQRSRSVGGLFAIKAADRQPE